MRLFARQVILVICCASAGMVIAQSPPNETAAPRSTALEESLAPAVAAQPLVLKTGDRLSVQLSNWLREQGHELSWDAHANTLGRIRDVQMLEEFHAQGSLVQVLSALLTPFNFEADVIDMGSKKRVIVRNASNRY